MEYVVPKEWDGSKAHTFFKQYIGLSSRMIIRLKHTENGITVGGELCRTVDILHEGDIVKIRLPEEAINIETADIPLDIVYEDDYVLVINKPPYIAVHPSRGKPSPTIANAVAKYYQSKNEEHLFRPVNRLDKNTSGLLLVAKTAPIAYSLTGKSQKEYYAIVEGSLEGEGVIDQPIRVKEGSFITREVGEGGKSSITHWESMNHTEDASLIHLWLETGRTHQIRVHMAWLGHALLGDTLYGRESSDIGRQALHCGKLKFFHPIKKEWMETESPIPDDMDNVLKKIG